MRFTQLSPGAVGGLGLLAHEVGKLDPVEGEVTNAPLVSPGLDHEGEEVSVLVGAAGVRLALVPDGASDAVADGGLEHAVVDVARAVVAGHLALKLLDLLLVALGLGLLILLFVLFPRGDQVLVLGVFFENVATHPRLGGRPAPGVVDQTDGHVVQGFINLPAKEEPDRRKALRRLRGAGLPVAR